jgi:hypothetical protein
MAVGVFAETIERDVTTVAFTARTFFTLNVAGTLVTGPLFSSRLTRAVARTVGRCVAFLVADSAGLIQERRTDDFSISAWLVLHVVAGVFGFGAASIVADLTVGGLGLGSSIERL